MDTRTKNVLAERDIQAQQKPESDKEIKMRQTMIKRYQQRNKNLLFTVSAIKSITRARSETSETGKSSPKSDQRGNDNREVRISVKSLENEEFEEKVLSCTVCQQEFVSTDEVVCCEATERHVFHLNCLYQKAQNIVKLANYRNYTCKHCCAKYEICVRPLKKLEISRKAS